MARNILRLLALCLTLGLAPLAQAQGTEGTAAAINYDAWNAVAALAEAEVEDPRSSEDVLNATRAEIVSMRAQFLAAQTELGERVTSLQEQIAALGPAPAEGESEAAEITQRRSELDALLDEREAPLRAADEAYARTEAIIRAIDRELRERQANALLALGPSPLNPTTWLAAFEALKASTLTVFSEVRSAWNDPAYHTEMITDLPITLAALALAALMLLRGRHWMEQLTTRLLQGTAILRGRVVAAFFVSLSQLVVPFVGLLLLRTAVSLTRMTGPLIDELTAAMIPAGMAVFGARWLSLHIFPIVDDPRLSLNMSAPDRQSARRLALVFGLLSGVATLYVPFISPDWQPVEAQAALMFPLVVLAALSLLRFAQVLARHTPRERIIDEQSVETAPFFDRMLGLGVRTLWILGVLAPVLGAVGYMAAAQHIVFPAIQSLALVGVVMVLHRLVTAIYTAIVGEDDISAHGLVPALSGLALSTLALAPLALIWGARSTDLTEIYTRLSEGVSLGGARLSPTNVLWFLAVFGIGYVFTRALQGALGTSVLPKTSMERGAQKAIVSGVGYVGLFAAALMAFSVAGIDLSGLAIVAGALSVGVGFGLQTIVSNFVSGIILLIERPVAEGDWVEVGTTNGIIERISVRATVIETFDRSKVIVPNADLITGAVTNFTKSSRTGRLIVPVGVAYGTDTRKVEAILREIVEAEPMVVMDPAPSVFLMRFGADALEFEVRAILRDVNFKLSVASNVNHRIVQRFAEEGIEIPFAQRDIWLRNPEVLAPRPATAEAARPPFAPPVEHSADNAADSSDEPQTEFREATR